MISANARSDAVRESGASREVVSAPNRSLRRIEPGEVMRTTAPAAVPAIPAAHQRRTNPRSGAGTTRPDSRSAVRSTTTTTIAVSSDSVARKAATIAATASATARPRRERASRKGISAAQARTGGSVCETDAAGQ